MLNTDEIEKNNLDLLIRYLYVGVTRAMDYRDAAYEAAFPESIGFIEDDFRK